MKLTIPQIKKATADHFGISLETLMAPRRKPEIVRPRHVSMYLSRHLIKDISLGQIGRGFGGHHHTTVLNAIQRIEYLCRIDGDFAKKVEALRKKLIAIKLGQVDPAIFVSPERAA